MKDYYRTITEISFVQNPFPEFGRPPLVACPDATMGLLLSAGVLIDRPRSSRMLASRFPVCAITGFVTSADFLHFLFRGGPIGSRPSEITAREGTGNGEGETEQERDAHLANGTDGRTDGDSSFIEGNGGERRGAFASLARVFATRLEMRSDAKHNSPSTNSRVFGVR